MSDPNNDAQNFFSGMRPTIRIPPRGGHHSVQLTEYVKYEIPDYGFPFEVDTLRDPTEYPVGPAGRLIAGSKRVARFREHGSPLSSGKINADTALASNYEEMRTECHGGSLIATGAQDVAVHSEKQPNAFRDGAADEGLRTRDVTMSDGGVHKDSQCTLSVE